MSYFKQTSLIVECECGVLNYLDPFTFWNFKGKLKCAGCDDIFYYELENGVRVKGPEKAEGPYDKLPGFAETKDWEPITDPEKVNAPPQARPDFQGKPIPIIRNVRGKLVSGRPLAAEDLVGSRPRFILEGKVPKNNND
jgi:hypothetical protein